MPTICILLERLPGLWNWTNRPAASNEQITENWDPNSNWSLEKSFHIQPVFSQHCI